MGHIHRISGPVIVARGLDAKMYDLLRVGEEELMGEVIKIVGENIIAQVYEETSGLRPGEPVSSTGKPLSVELGPGVLKSIFDGIQRPLSGIAAKEGLFIKRGVKVDSIDRDKKWDFEAKAKKGQEVERGDVLGTVKETEVIEHKILAPTDGKVIEIHEGKKSAEDIVAVIEEYGKRQEVKLISTWPVRIPRPYKRKLAPEVPLITGQRVVDMFFPLAKGGAAAIPGPFGSGKTVTQQALAKWSDTDLVVYIGCGERGNEMTEVLKEFPHLEDPKTGKPLMERTVLIANTSNMPVAAREASVYTGITIAEYYRDMGYDIALMADSTSRWAEAMREISGRLEEMPGEEGYPAYLARKLAEFYERAGRVITLGKGERYGSVTVIGAVSPPGGDISEPVSQNTLRVTKVFLALDASLAHRRHFPAIHWLKSYSLYTQTLKDWYEEKYEGWDAMREVAMGILQKEAELQEIVQLVGPDALPEKEQGLLLIAKSIREDFLQQSAYSEDAYCSPQKQYYMLKAILTLRDAVNKAIERGKRVKEIAESEIMEKIARMKEMKNDDEDGFKQLISRIKAGV
ncbi:MAG: V-type ATP synthase subunit A [Candidatus Anstonellales archaeon]